MPEKPFNKYRAAVEVLLRGREVLVESLADEILGNPEELADGGFVFNEFLEGQGTRLHFLCLLVAQLEQSADILDERSTPAPDDLPPPKKTRRSRSKKVTQQASAESPADDG